MVTPAFLGFNIGRSAMLVAQHNLEVTGHNIANSGVEGYSRQRLHLQANPDIFGLGSQYPGSVGQGVQADRLERLRNEFLDKEYRLKTQEKTFYETRVAYTERMQSFLGELNDTGLGKIIEKFFDSWQEASMRPDDLFLRQSVIAAGDDLTYGLKNFTENIQRLQEDAHRDLEGSVQRVNKITESIAILNAQIGGRISMGDNPADLYDSRDRLLDELGSMMKISTRVAENGAVQVQSDGKTLVAQDIDHPITLRRQTDYLRSQTAVGFPFTLNRGDLKINGIDIIGNDNPVTVTTAADAGQLLSQINKHAGKTGVIASLDAAGHLLLAGSGESSSFVNIEVTGTGLSLSGLVGGDYTLTSSSTLSIDNGTYLHQVGGKLESLIDTRSKVLPDTLQRLHQFTSTLIKRVNMIHEQAYNLDGEKNQPFFVGTNPAEIEVGPSLRANPALLALASSANFPPGDGSQAIRIYQLRTQAMVGAENMEDYYRSLVTNVGTTIGQAQQRVDTLQKVQDEVENQRQSVSGVNMDEELSNMLQFQRSFSAAARVMNTMDEMLSQIVNGLGAGR